MYRKDFFRGNIALAPGEHTLEVVKPGMGRFRPRKLMVTKEGRIEQALPSGELKPVINELLFSIPRTGDEPPSDWIPDRAK